MNAILPVNVDDLLRARRVESARIEFKAGWDPRTTGRQVLKTLCAFANDYHNLNGGYVVIGVAERDGRAALPPAGLPDGAVEAAQKWLRGNCNRLDPAYQPLLSPETVAGRRILVIRAPASKTKPHRRPTAPAAPRSTGPGRRATDRPAQDLPGDGAERFAAAAVRLRPVPHLVPRHAADPPRLGRGGVAARVEQRRTTRRLTCENHVFILFS